MHQSMKWKGTVILNNVFVQSNYGRNKWHDMWPSLLLHNSIYPLGSSDLSNLKARLKAQQDYHTSSSLFQCICPINNKLTPWPSTVQLYKFSVHGTLWRKSQPNICTHTQLFSKYCPDLPWSAVPPPKSPNKNLLTNLLVLQCFPCKLHSKYISAKRTV